MGILEILEKTLYGIATNPFVGCFLVVTLVEIVPIKINPWSSILRWIGSKTTGNLREIVWELKRDFEDYRANSLRWDILDFANSCRNGREHSKDEWRHVLDQLKFYEEYVEQHNINNGVFEEDAKYLRELYQERNKKNDFFVRR